MSFNEFYNKNYNDVVRHLFLKLRNEDEAKDFAQNIFMKIFSNWKNIDVNKASPRTYLFATVKNSLIDYYRTKKLGERVNLNTHESLQEENDNTEFYTPVEMSNPMQKLLGDEYVKNFKKILKSLPILQKRCVILYLKGFKMKEIAVELGTTTGTICPMVKQLREKFQKAYGLV